MRKLRQLTIAVVLTLALSASAFAGIIGSGPEPPPDPSPPSANATGIIGTSPSAAQPADALTVPAVDIALDLLQSVLSAF